LADCVPHHAAPETKAAAERARLLIEQAEALGEPPEDPLLLFSVLFGLWAANVLAFNGDVCLDLAAHFLTLAEKQGSTAPLMVGYRNLAVSLFYAGAIAQSRVHYDRANALYDPTEHRPLATRFAADVRVVLLSYRSWALWLLGYPEAALTDSDDALKNGRETGQAATLLFALYFVSSLHIWRGDYAAANPLLDEAIALADEKGALLWKANTMMSQGWLLASTAKAPSAVQTMTLGIAAWRSTGSTLWIPFYLSHLARAHAELGQLDDARRCIGDAMSAMETTKEKWCEAEVNRIAGETALLSPEPHTAKAEASFERALAVARRQQAKSWELRASMSLARLWRDQGKVQQARELLVPVYGWFTEGLTRVI
jgi:predicted ATPase